MNTPNDGGPAFPKVSAPNGAQVICHGMSLRDWFAGMALPELIKLNLQSSTDITLSVSQRAYQWADAMLKAREVKP